MSGLSWLARQDAFAVCVLPSFPNVYWVKPTSHILILTVVTSGKWLLAVPRKRQTHRNWFRRKEHGKLVKLLWSEDLSEDGTGTISAKANVARLHRLDGLMWLKEMHSWNALSEISTAVLTITVCLCQQLWNPWVEFYTMLQCLSHQADNTDGNNVPHVAQPNEAGLSEALSDLSLTFLGLPVFKNGDMSLASFVVSSAPSPELMAATTRTRSSVSPE